MEAYILVSLSDTDEREVVEDLKDNEEVKDAHILFGEWDMMAKVEIENPEALAHFVMSEIRPLPGVKLTSTLIVAK